MASDKNIENLSKEIIKPSLDLGKDYAEIGLDELLEEGILKEIPVVKTLVAIVKTGVAVKQRFFIKKFLVFLKESKSGDPNSEAAKEFEEKFENDKSFRNKVTEQVLIFIEDLDSLNKSRILAHLFRAYLAKEIDWKRFISLVSCMKTLQEATFYYLEVLSRAEFNFGLGTGRKISEVGKLLREKHSSFDQSSMNELEALFMASGIGYRNGTLFSITKLGQDLYKYGISKVLNEEASSPRTVI